MQKRRILAVTTLGGASLLTMSGVGMAAAGAVSPTPAAAPATPAAISATATPAAVSSGAAEPASAAPVPGGGISVPAGGVGPTSTGGGNEIAIALLLSVGGVLTASTLVGGGRLLLNRRA